MTDILRHLKTGGLPIPCFARNDGVRHDWLQSYAETLITRDLSLADATLHRIGYLQGAAFLRALALQQGREVNVSQLASAASLSRSTAKRVLAALEALSVIDLVPGEMIAVKSTHKLRVAWKDVALWNFFAGVPDHLLPTDPTALKTLLALELRSQADSLTPRATLTHYRTRDGAEIPWIFRRQGQTVALDLIPAETVTKSDVKSLLAFVAADPSASGIIFAAPKALPVRLAKRVWVLPYTLAF